MLIKVTNKCGMGCSHCMEDSTVAGEHMSQETFEKAIDFTARIERLAWERKWSPPNILLSGGECTEHPDIVKMVEYVIARGYRPLLITNGMWLSNKELRESLLRPEWDDLFVQVTNDSRYYPTAPERISHDRVFYVDSLTLLLPLGRLARKKGERELPIKSAPSSFNLRSLTRSFRSFEEAVAMLRARTSLGMSGHCTPSIADNGDVMIGETRLCWKIGTVDSTNEELTKAVLDMRECNRCGLETGLSQQHKRAIGLSTLYVEGEGA